MSIIIGDILTHRITHNVGIYVGRIGGMPSVQTASDQKHINHYYGSCQLIEEYWNKI